MGQVKRPELIVPLRVISAALPAHAQFRIVQRPSIDRHGRSIAQPVLMLDLSLQDIDAIEECLGDE